MKTLAKYKKFAAAAVGALIVTIPIVWDHHVTQAEAITLVATWAAALGVRQFQNAD